MRTSITLRNENTQEGNTWFSNALDPGPDAGEVQLHMPRHLWLSLGQPEYIQVTIDPDPRSCACSS